MEWFILLDGDLLPEAQAKLSVLIADFCFDGVCEVTAVVNGTLVDFERSALLTCLLHRTVSTVLEDWWRQMHHKLIEQNHPIEGVVYDARFRRMRIQL